MTFEIRDIESLHTALLEMLRVLHQTATEEQIPYSLAYGTALGFARDGGLIPWDTDCDVVVPFDRLPELELALASATEGTSITVEQRGASGYDRLFPRIAIANVGQNLVHLDLFALVGTFSTRHLARLHLLIGRTLALSYKFRKGKPNESFRPYSRKWIIAHALRLTLKPIPSSLIERTFRRVATLRNINKCKRVINLTGYYGYREILDVSLYFPSKTVT